MNDFETFATLFDELVSDVKASYYSSYYMKDEYHTMTYFQPTLFWVLDNGQGFHEWGNTFITTPQAMIDDIRKQLSERGKL